MNTSPVIFLDDDCAMGAASFAAVDFCERASSRSAIIRARMALGNMSRPATFARLSFSHGIETLDLLAHFSKIIGTVAYAHLTLELALHVTRQRVYNVCLGRPLILEREVDAFGELSGQPDGEGFDFVLVDGNGLRGCGPW